MRRIGLALLLILLMPAAAGAGSRDLGRFPGTLMGDGRYVAAADAANSTLRVLDASTGRRQSVAFPEGCFPATLTAGRVLFNCPTELDPVTYATGLTYDLRTRRTASLPPLTIAALGSSGEATNEARYVDVGREWATVVRSGYHYEFTRYVRLRDGAISEGPGVDRRRVAALDAEGVTRRLCSPMQRPLGPDGFIGLAPGPLTVIGRRAAAVHQAESPTGGVVSRVRLQQCGKPPRTVRRCRTGCGNVVLDDRTLAWVEASGLGSIVTMRSLRTGRTRSFPRLGQTQLQLVRHRLYTLSGDRLRVLTP